jgi:hypothetical protein
VVKAHTRTGRQLRSGALGRHKVTQAMQRVAMVASQNVVTHQHRAPGSSHGLRQAREACCMCRFSYAQQQPHATRHTHTTHVTERRDSCGDVDQHATTEACTTSSSSKARHGGYAAHSEAHVARPNVDIRSTCAVRIARGTEPLYKLQVPQMLPSPLKPQTHYRAAHHTTHPCPYHSSCATLLQAYCT